MEGLVSHEGQQLTAHANEIDKDTVAIEAESASRNLGNLRELATSHIRVAGAVDSLAKRNGWGEEETAIQKRNAMTRVHVAVLGAALDGGNIVYARTYLEQHGEDMNEAPRSKAAAMIKQLEAGQAVKSAVDQVESSGLTFADKAKTLREMFKDEPESLKDAFGELERRRKALDVERREAEGEIWDMYSGFGGSKPMTLHEIKKTPQWVAMGGDDRHRLARAMEADARRNEGKESPNEGMERYAAYLDIKDNPERLLQMSDKELLARTGELGNTLVRKLLDDKRAIAKDFVSLTRAKLDLKQFDDLTAQAGYRKERKSDKALLGLLREEWRDSIVARQTRSMSELDQTQKEEILQGLLKTHVIKRLRSDFSPARLFGSQTYDEERPVFEALQEVPDSYISLVRAKAKAKGFEPTEEQILRAYHLDKQRGLIPPTE